MFVSKDRVPVTIDDKDVIYILPKMPFGVKQKAMSAITHISQAAGGQGADVALDIGAYNIALMTLNIVGWEGPQFEGVPCTPDNIEQLDPDEPLVVRVLEEIGRRNPVTKDRAAPNAPAPVGSTSSRTKSNLRALGTGT